MSGTKRKPSRQVERKYIVDVVERFFPNPRFKRYNMPITPVDAEFRRKYPGLSPQAFTRYRRYCDAVVATDKELLLIEAKIRRPIDGLGQLLLYRHYAPFVPELKPFLSLPIVPVLASPKKDTFLIPVCKSNGFRYLLVPTDDSREYLKETGFI